MGGWFLSTAMANYRAGLIAAVASGGGEHGAQSSVAQYASTFMQLWWLALVIGGAFFLFAPLMNRLMPGLKQSARAPLGRRPSNTPDACDQNTRGDSGVSPPL